MRLYHEGATVDGQTVSGSGFYLPGKNMIVLNADSKRSAAWHEFFHAVVHGQNETANRIVSKVQQYANQKAKVQTTEGEVNVYELYRKHAMENDGASEAEADAIAAEEIAADLANVAGLLREDYDSLSEAEQKYIDTTVELMQALFEGAAFSEILEEIEQLIDDAQSGEKIVSELRHSGVDVLKSTEQLSPEELREAYQKPITREDVQAVRSIGRKSINDLSSAEIQKLGKWAYKYYQTLKEKSPFFRAWFGDWREYDKTKVNFIPVSSDFTDIQNIPRNANGYKNIDTNWNILIVRDGIDETANKKGTRSAEYKALTDIDKMVSNAVLLDTVTVSDPSGKMGASSVFVHHLYCPVITNGQKAIAKLYIKEDIQGSHKFYLTKIERMPTDSGSSHFESVAIGENIAAEDILDISIADIFDFVNRNDKNFEKDSKHPVYFNPKSVNPALLNEDGTPKVFYHGTREHFSEFILQDNARFGRSLGDGFYFTEDYNRAFKYANGIFSNGKDRGGIIMPVYLKMENPT